MKKLKSINKAFKAMQNNQTVLFVTHLGVEDEGKIFAIYSDGTVGIEWKSGFNYVHGLWSGNIYIANPE